MDDIIGRQLNIDDRVFRDMECVGCLELLLRVVEREEV
jgi:hypothetical protein